MGLPGGSQVARGAQFLASYTWWKLEPHPEWVDNPGTQDDPFGSYAAGIPGELRIIYMWNPRIPWEDQPPRVLNIEPDVAYDALYFNPRTGEAFPAGPVEPQADGSWEVPMQPEMNDWVLVLESERSPREGPSTP
jgi:hypothetical protein